MNEVMVCTLGPSATVEALQRTEDIRSLSALVAGHFAAHQSTSRELKLRIQLTAELSERSTSRIQ